MLNPVALFRSGSSRSSSSRFLVTSSGGSKESGSESRSDVSDESCMISGSHQTTLDRLFAWEKKLYEEVKVTNKRSKQVETIENLVLISVGYKLNSLSCVVTVWRTCSKSI